MDTSPVLTPDHDLLIELRTELRGMRADLKTFTDDTKERLTRLEETKMDKSAFNEYLLAYQKRDGDKESRLRFLERWGWALWGGLVVIQFAVIAYLTIHR